MGSALALILVFEGFRSGLYQQMRDFPAGLPADLVVVPSGVENLSTSRSLLPPGLESTLAGRPGVASVEALGGIPQILEHEGLTSPVYVVVYRERAAPTTLVRGRLGASVGEVVVDEGLAAAFDLDLGDEIEALDRRFTVVGVSRRSAALFTPFVFVRDRDLRPLLPPQLLLLGLDPTRGFLLVEADEGVEPEELRAALQMDGVELRTPAELADADVRMARTMMGPVMDFLVGLAWLLGLAVVCMTTYASVLQRRRELATVKALGGSTAWIVRSVLAETLALALPAFLFGIASAVAMAWAVRTASPGMLVLPLEAAGVTRTAAAAVLFPLLGSLPPLVRVARLAPAEVFRG